MTMKEAKITEIESYAVQQNLQSLRNRVNELGVSEPLVQSLGRTRIVVDLPGVQDSADAKRILNKFANLDFRLVAKPDARPSETESYPYEGGRTIVVERRNIVTGDRVTNAVQDYDPQDNLPQVSITLDGAGGDRMHDATKDNVGNQMAILYKELKPRTRTVLDRRQRGGRELQRRREDADQRRDDPFGARLSLPHHRRGARAKRAIWRCCCAPVRWRRRCTSSKNARSVRASAKTTFAPVCARRSAATFSCCCVWSSTTKRSA